MALRSLAALGIVICLYVSVDLVEATAMAGDGALRVVYAYAFRLPSVISQMLPIALVMGILASLGGLKSTGQWDGFCSAGISPGTLIGGMLVLSLAAALVSYPLCTNWAPRAQALYGAAVACEVRVDGTGQWYTEGRHLTYHGDSASDVEIHLQRDDDGEAVAWRRRGGMGKTLEWSKEEGWSSGRKSDGIRGARRPVGAVEPPGGRDGLVGMDLTNQEILELAHRVEAGGHGAVRLFSMLALRQALMLGNFLLPLIALLVGVQVGTRRTTTLLSIGLGVCVLFWMILAVTWNGVVTGAWAPWVVSPGAVVWFLTLGIVTALTVRKLFRS